LKVYQNSENRVELIKGLLIFFGDTVFAIDWIEAITLLEVIPNNTFVSAQAKDKLTIYRTNYAVASQK